MQSLTLTEIVTLIHSTNPHARIGVFVDATAMESPSSDLMQELSSQINHRQHSLELVQSFTTVVSEFGQPQGVGTDYSCIENHPATSDLDVVIVITDGFGLPVTPSDPQKWVWLTTPESWSWMDEAGMITFSLQSELASV